MRILKCDLCKKEIKKEPIIAGVGFFPQVELCEKCGAPILRFLKKHKFIKSEKTKKK
jgi:rRNA maturation endonuclease Nob1